jgi:lipoprotein-anchoring transpeptidase ErfK/SrfK
MGTAGTARRIATWKVVLAVLGGLLVLAGAGAVAEASAWHARQVAAEVLLPGTTVAGVDLGGRPFADAATTAEAAAAELLGRPLAFGHAEQRFDLDPQALGATTTAEGAAAQAVAATRDASPVQRLLARWFGAAVGPELTVSLTLPDEAIDAFVMGIVDVLDRTPVDASLTWTGEELALQEHAVGLALDRTATAALIREALRTAPVGLLPLPVHERPHTVATEVVAPLLPVAEAAADALLDRPVHVVHGDQEWTVTPRQVGARPEVQRYVTAALAVLPQPSTTAEEPAPLATTAASGVPAPALTPADVPVELVLDVPAEGVVAAMDAIASQVEAEAREAAIDTSSGWVELIREQTGRAVDRQRAADLLGDALRQGGDVVELPVTVTEPTTTSDAFSHVLLVRQDLRRLYLYRDGEIAREWTVAIGAAGHRTPTGTFTVGTKRYLPTWHNPAPDGWGADMPASIPPGPANPLGLRALNWNNASGHDTLIRFHGTNNLGSIGSAASKGCIRLRNADIVELYDLVPTGTTIISTWG